MEVNIVQQLCSTGTDGKQGGRKQPVNTGGCAPVPAELELPSDFSESPPAPAQQGPTKSPTSSLQLFNRNSKRFSYNELKNPCNWKNITYTRPGWIPYHLPFLRPGNQYSELRANSTVVFTGMAPPYGKGPRRVPCGVTCYNHREGPWCEVQSQNGTRICILVAPPPSNPP